MISFNIFIQRIKNWLFPKKDNVVILPSIETHPNIINTSNANLEKSDLTEIIIGNNKYHIVFQKIDKIDINHEWTQINQKDNSNFFSQISATATFGGIAEYSTNGVYMATVNPNKLMTYVDGKLSSITLNGKQFGSHAGFTQATTAILTPVLIFQFTSMITGQYYFNLLNKQLNSIQININQILQLHHNERIAKIKAITDRVISWEKSKFFTNEDFLSIETLKLELATIRYEYLIAAQQQLEESLFPTPSSIKKNIETNIIISPIESLKRNSLILFESTNQKLKILYDNSQTESIVDAFASVFENSGRRADKLMQKVNQSKFMFFVEASLEADKLYQYIQLIELKANLLYKNPNENRIGKISQLHENLLNFDEDNDSIAKKANMSIKYLESKLLELFAQYKLNSYINQTEISQYISDIKKQFSRIDKYSNYNVELTKQRKQIAGLFYSNEEIVIDNRENNQKIYIKSKTNSSNSHKLS